MPDARCRARAGRRGARALLAAGCAALLCGCWSGRVLFSYEPPSWSALGDPSSLRASLTVSALLHGYAPRFDISTNVDPVASLSAALTSLSYAAVVVGPLVSLQWSDFVPRFPGTRFVLVDVSPPAQPPANAVFLSFDRTTAFAEAGRIAAAAVRPGNGGGSPGGLIGILACEGSGLSSEESDAFSRGAAAALNGVVPESQTLGVSPDPKDIRASVQQMRDQGVAVFLLGLGERDPDGLEAVRDAGARAVVSDWQSSQALPGSVLASIDEDVPAGIARSLDALRRHVTHVEGPVRIVRGRKI